MKMRQTVIIKRDRRKWT